MTETKARAGGAMPAAQPAMAQDVATYPGADVKTAMAGFLNAFNGF